MTKIKSSSILLLAAVTAGLAGADAAAAETPAPAATPAAVAPTTLAGAITGGKAHVELRYRLETVDQDPFADDATASTLRTRLNYQTGEWNHLSAFLEADNVTVIGNDRTYNSTVNGVTDRPIVADPEYTEANQAYLQLKLGTFTGIGGRQRIVLDNQRFVGNVGWRQNEQTYDAVTLKLGAIPRTQFFYSWVGNVNRITGPDDGRPITATSGFPGDLGSSSSLVNAKIDLGSFGSLVLFDYYLSLEGNHAYPPARTKNLSNNSYGFYYTGSYKFSETTKLNWAGSYAEQSEAGASQLDYNASYYLLEAGLGVKNFGVKVGWEVLGGNDAPNTTGFQTPLATLHIFQGWADKFTTTPQAGVEDFYVGGSANFGALALNLIWHEFSAEATSADYGTEWNASAGYKFGKNYEVLAKFADYQADDFATDTTKFWLQLSATF